MNTAAGNEFPVTGGIHTERFRESTTGRLHRVGEMNSEDGSSYGSMILRIWSWCWTESPWAQAPWLYVKSEGICMKTCTLQTDAWSQSCFLIVKCLWYLLSVPLPSLLLLLLSDLPSLLLLPSHSLSSLVIFAFIRGKCQYLEVLCLVRLFFPPKNIVYVGGFVQHVF